MKLKIKKLHPDAIIPIRGSEKASGLDLYALEDVTLYAGDTKIIRTGIVFGIPEGYEVQVRPRSGLSLNSGLIVKNAPGTIDQDYTGECGVIMHLLVRTTADDSGNIMADVSHSHTIKKGSRIAQAVLCPVVLAEIEETDDLGETARGSGAFGSTGV